MANCQRRRTKRGKSGQSHHLSVNSSASASSTTASHQPSLGPSVASTRLPTSMSAQPHGALPFDEPAGGLGSGVGGSSAPEPSPVLAFSLARLASEAA